MGLDSVKDVASWGALIGVVLPLLIAVLNQPRWTPQQRQLLAVGVSTVAGVGTVIASGNFDLQNWLVTIAAVIGAAQAAYAVLWKPTNIAPTIETKTSGGDEAGAASYGYAAVGLIVLGLLIVFFTTLDPVGWVLLVIGAALAAAALAG